MAQSFEDTIKKLHEQIKDFSNSYSYQQEVVERVKEITFNLTDISSNQEKISNKIVDINQTYSDISKDLKNTGKTISKLNDDYKDISNVLKNIPKNFEDFDKEIENLTKVLKNKEIEIAKSKFTSTGSKSGSSVSTIGEMDNLNRTGKFVYNVLPYLKTIFDWGKKSFGIIGEMDNSISKLNSQMGLSSASQEKYKKSVFETAFQTAHLYGKTTKDMVEMQSTLFSELGRNVLMSTEGMKDLSAMSLILGSNGAAAKFAGDMDQVGMSLSSSLNYFEKVRDAAGKSGVDMVKASSVVQANIKKAQSYGFKDGVNSLASMAVNSLKIRGNMQEIFNLADKNRTLESAIENAAKTQVLGGQFAQFADPLMNLYQSLNDVEGLDKRINQLGNSLMTFNNKNGTMEYNSSIDRERAKYFAEQMGIGFDELNSRWTRQGILNEVNRQVGSLNYRGGEVMNEVEQDIVKSQATWNQEMNNKKGAWVVTTMGDDGKMKEIDITKLSTKETEFLKPQQQNVAQIARSTMGIGDKLDAIEKAIKEGRGGVLYNLIGKPFHDLTNKIGEILGGLGQQIVGIGANILSLGAGIWTVYKGSRMGSNLIKRILTSRSGYGTTGGVAGTAISTTTSSIDKIKEGKVSRSEARILNEKGYRFDKSTGRWRGTDGGKWVKATIVSEELAKASSTTGKASRFAKFGKFFKGAGTGLGLGLASAGLDLGKDYLINSGKIKEGGVADYAMSIGSGALTGAAIGSIFPVIGTAIGAGIGGLFSLGKKIFSSHKYDVNNLLNKEGKAYSKITAQQGFFDAIENDAIDPLKEIAKSAYNIESILRTKFKIDSNNLTENEREKLEKAKVDLSKFNTDPFRNYKVVQDNIDSNIGQPAHITRGNQSYITSPNDTIIATQPGGKYWNRSGLSLDSPKIELPNYNNQRNIQEIKPINLNINGTIKLDGDGKSADISEIMNNPTLIKLITDAIKRSIETSDKQGKIKDINNNILGNYYNRS